MAVNAQPSRLVKILKDSQPPADSDCSQPLSQHADRRQLRQQLRAQRKALSPAQQHKAAQQLAQRLSRDPDFRRAKHIAVYLANDGEVDPSELIRRALALGKVCYLPVLKAGASAMEFARYAPGDKLSPNRFGIPEPLPRAPRRPAEQLDLVCMPLVGFDTAGNRLGMGGGFYDRTFTYKLSRINASPVLMGLAHECQKVDQLPKERWDVPLDVIATNHRLYRPARAKQPRLRLENRTKR